MLGKTYLNRMGQKNSQLRLMKLLLTVMGLFTVLNTYLLHRALDSRATVLVPAGGITEEMAVFSGHADPKYLGLMVRHVMNLAANYTQNTARAQFDQLLGMFDSRHYPKALAMFLEIAEDVEYTRAASAFGIEQMTFKSGGDEVEVSGILRQFIGDKMVERRNAVYEIRYTVRDGRFLLKGIGEKEGTR